MNNEFENNLSNIFAESYKVLPDEPFVNNVTKLITSQEHKRRNSRMALIAACFILFGMYSSTINKFILSSQSIVLQWLSSKITEQLVDFGIVLYLPFTDPLPLASFMIMLFGVIATLSWVVILYIANNQRRLATNSFNS